MSALVVPAALSLLQSASTGGNRADGSSAGHSGAGAAWDMERGLLALGTLASAPGSNLLRELPNMHLAVLQVLGRPDMPAEVRAIAAWVLSRHIGWLFSACEGSFRHADIPYDVLIDQYLSPLVQALFACMMHESSRLQAAAVSALSILYDLGGPEMSRYMDACCGAVVTCQAHYGHRSYALLCDLLQYLCALCPSPERSTPLVSTLPSVVHRALSLDTQNFMLFPIFDALVCIVPRVAAHFQQYVTSTVSIALQIASKTISTLERDANKNRSNSNSDSSSSGGSSGSSGGNNSSSSSNSSRSGSSSFMNGNTDQTSGEIVYEEFAGKAFELLCSVLENLESYGAVETFRRCNIPEIVPVCGTDNPVDAMMNIAHTVLSHTNTTEAGGKQCKFHPFSVASSFSCLSKDCAMHPTKFADTPLLGSFHLTSISLVFSRFLLQPHCSRWSIH